MWYDVHWGTPKFNPDRNASLEALHALDAAYTEDPSLDYPWREWHMLINHAKEIGHPPPSYEREILRRAGEVFREGKPRPFVGYRFRDVRYRVGDWVVKLPGEFVKQPPSRFAADVAAIEARVEDPDAEPADLLAAVEALTRIASFNAVRADPMMFVNVAPRPLPDEFGVDAAGADRYLAAHRPPPGRAPAERFAHQGTDSRGVAFLFKETPSTPEAPAYSLSGMTVTEGQVAVTTIACTDREDVEVAERIWRTVDPFGAP
jgi:hypothetical protein